MPFFNVLIWESLVPFITGLNQVLTTHEPGYPYNLEQAKGGAVRQIPTAVDKRKRLIGPTLLNGPAHVQGKLICLRSLVEAQDRSHEESMEKENCSSVQEAEREKEEFRVRLVLSMSCAPWPNNIPLSLCSYRFYSSQ